MDLHYELSFIQYNQQQQEEPTSENTHRSTNRKVLRQIKDYILFKVLCEQ